MQKNTLNAYGWFAFPDEGTYTLISDEYVMNALLNRKQYSFLFPEIMLNKYQC